MNVGTTWWASWESQSQSLTLFLVLSDPHVCFAPLNLCYELLPKCWNDKVATVGKCQWHQMSIEVDTKWSQKATNMSFAKKIL